MKLYTRTGDKGLTSVIGGRVSKDHARVEAYGTLDELNACLGLAVVIAGGRGDPAARVKAEMLEQFAFIQHELFDCGSDLAYVSPTSEQLKVTPEMTNRLEEWIDQYEAETPPIQRFILPGGSELASQLHVCRTVCRRAERRIVSLAETESCPAEVIAYVNRLSDYFFAAARAANSYLGVTDVEYERGAHVFHRKES